MNNYYFCSLEKSYLRLARSEHNCKYFVDDSKTDMLWEIPGNFPVKHWWQNVVVEIVEC